MLKMQYKVVDGRNVCNNGEVIIDHVKHVVKNGFVKCNAGLNGSAWDTTKESSVCPKCYSQPIQLDLKFN